MHRTKGRSRYNSIASKNKNLLKLCWKSVSNWWAGKSSKPWYYIPNPSVHNYVYHTRPRRRQDKILCQKILNGSVDGEDAIFNLDKKPHSYYW